MNLRVVFLHNLICLLRKNDSCWSEHCCILSTFRKLNFGFNTDYSQEGKKVLEAKSRSEVNYPFIMAYFGCLGKHYITPCTSVIVLN